MTLFLAIALCTPLPIQEEPITNWKEAYNAAKAGKVVLLKLSNIETKELQSYTVYLVDGKTHFGLMEVYFTNGGEIDVDTRFDFNLTTTLANMDAPPSNRTKIILKTASGVAIKFSIQFEVLKLED
jgi:hypothetical protein